MAETFAEVARALAEHEDVPAKLEKIALLAVEHLDACEFAGFSIVEQSKIQSPAASNEIPRLLDGIQDETGEGPCLDAIREREVFQTGDLRAEVRWPAFSRRAHDETGIVSILSLRLFIEQDTMAALNLYSTAEDAFDETDAALGTVFAAHAAVAMQAARREEDLEAKAMARDIIGQAKGILMVRSGVDDEQAFQMLEVASQRMNLELRNVAQNVVDGSSEEAPLL